MVDERHSSVGMGNVRVMFTVVGADGDDHDVILHADAGTRMSEVARLLGAQRLYAGQVPLDPESRLADAAIRDGCRIGADRPDGEHTGPMLPAAADAVLPLVPADDGPALLVPRLPRLLPPTAVRHFTLPAPPARKPLAWPPRRRRELREYEQERARIEAAADSALAAEEDRRRAEYPDPAAAYAIATGPGSRLWERRPGDRDFLELRVGTGDRLSVMSLDDPATAQSRMLELHDAPETIRLTDPPAHGGGMLRVRGAADMTRAACRWLVAQIAILHSPEDVRICLLAGPSARADWEWIRWLPHCRLPRGNTEPAWIGTDAETVIQRTAELLGIIDGRTGADGPAVVAIFDDWSQVRSGPFISRIVRQGPQADVYAIRLDPHDHGLPEGCPPLTRPSQTEVRPHTVWAGRRGKGTVCSEFVDAAWCERVARALAPLRDGDARGRGVPETSRLLDVLDLNPSAPEEIVRRWTDGDGSPSAVIGESADGPFGIDLRRDGPHALVAGATGSGKSELLQTIITSLAASSTPDAVTFLLIDYKGGSAFNDCADLPHTVGVIVDFDQHEAERVLAALAAELRRRELLLYQASAKDTDDYASLRNHQPGLQPLPRLVIVVDEFASLVHDVPDFIPGLVGIAQRGRSLGIHLILATQRPAGVVSADIRANTNLRIALRVTDQSESMDVIDAPDAAFISSSLPGRAYIRPLGGDPVPIQMCRVAGMAPRPFITPIGWEHLGKPASPPQGIADEAHITDLKTLVDAVQRASETLSIPPPHRPWLPPLPGAVVLSELKRPAHDGDGQLPPVPYGLEDLPAEHVQRTAAIDFAAFGHLLAAGDRFSGRSQLLRTIAGAIATTVSCADVHIYGIDSGDGTLLPISELPHCGTVATLAQADRATRLIDRLGQELDRRQELLARTRFYTIGDQRSNISRPQRLPHILVLIDRWESFAEALGEVRYGALTDTIMRILREGQRFGMHLVITGGRAVLTGPLAATAEDKLAFRLADHDDYTLVGLRRRDVPYDIPAGRAFRAGSGTEVQVALLDGGPTGSDQFAALRTLAETTRIRDAHVALAQRPFQVEAADLVSDRFHVGDTQGRPVGREDVLAWLRARHAAGGSVALLGPRRAGKTWVLRELERRLTGNGHQQVHSVTIQLPSSRVDTPDELAEVLDRRLRETRSPAQKLLDIALDNAGTPDRLAYLLDEVGRLAVYGPAAVSWLRDLGQAGAWLVYTGTEKDWQEAVRQALKAPGSSFGNDVDARTLGPLDERDAVTFLTGTAANLRVNLSDETAARIISMVGAWPFYLQVVGDAVVRAVQADDLKPLWDVRALRDLVDARLLDGWMTHFQGRWAEIGPAGRSVLLTDPGQLPGDLAPGQREDLGDVGLLLPGDRWLADPPFFDWVARNAAALRDGERRR
jgi:DNA segregation ATPase FtsK/SpoIIIE, S-DNA-T family